MTSEVAASGRRSKWAVAVRVFLVVLACVAAGSAIAVRNAMKPRATTPPPLPSPNGYDDLIRAGAMVRGDAPNKGDIRKAKLEELRAWVAANGEALKAIREGLAKPSRVPVVYDTDLKLELEHCQGCRQLYRLLAAEAEVAAQEGRADDAARAQLDGVRLGRAAGRGGLLVDFLVGVAIERQALEGLDRLREALSADATRGAIASLLASDADWPAFAEVLNLDTYWFERTSPYWNRLILRISGMGDKLREPADKATIRAMNGVATTRRREVVGLAEHLYFLEKKADPKSPEDLVPSYLPAIPVNPETGRPITEIPTSTPR